jgi:hypothetical protein
MSKMLEEEDDDDEIRVANGFQPFLLSIERSDLPLTSTICQLGSRLVRRGDDAVYGAGGRSA